MNKVNAKGIVMKYTKEEILETLRKCSFEGPLSGNPEIMQSTDPEVQEVMQEWFQSPEYLRGMLNLATETASDLRVLIQNHVWTHDCTRNDALHEIPDTKDIPNMFQIFKDYNAKYPKPKDYDWVKTASIKE